MTDATGRASGRGAAARRLLDEHVERWHADGFVHVQGFLSPDEVARAYEGVRREFPDRVEFDRNPMERPCLKDGLAFRLMPFAAEALSVMAFHPAVIDAVERLVGVRDIRLTQSIVRASYATEDTKDQLLHRDFHNNSLLAPHRDDTKFAQVPVILYYTDVSLGDAPTYVAPRAAGEGLPLLPSHVSREQAPDLYAQEWPVLAKAGDAFFYSMRTFHRGSAFTDPAGYRFVHHVAYRAAGNDWMDFSAWPLAMDTDAGRRCIESLDPRQLELLGFPPVGHAYWDEETLGYLAERYPKLDIRPYRHAAAASLQP